MIVVKDLAKKVICAAPLSIELSGSYQFLFNLFSPIDKIMQDWALRQTDFFSENDWKEIQLTKLKKILIHAEKNVPYWRRLFKNIGFVPENLKGFEEISRIPVLTRAGVKKIKIEKFTADNIPRWRFREAITSGSTGEPLKFYQDYRDNLRREVNTFHELRYAGVSRYNQIAVLDLENHHDLDNLGKRFKGWSKIKFRFSVIYPYLKSAPIVLIAGGFSLLRFLSLIRKENPSINFKALMYRGESISEKVRNNISRFYKCPVFTTYGSQECSLLGIECENHKLHLAPWVNYFEVLSDNGQVLSDGEEGNAVITFFENFALPFIRYEIGDNATINTKLCSCGRKSKTINFYGRDLEKIKFPDSDRVVSMRVLSRLINRSYYGDIRKYQFELRGRDIIIFRYFPTSTMTDDKRKSLTDSLKKFLDNQLQVILEEKSKINSSGTGKFKILIRS